MSETRAWDVVQKKYIEDYVVMPEGHGLRIGNIRDTSGKAVRMNKLIIERYTGKKDKQGVKIFENDYVKFWDSLAERYEYELIKFHDDEISSCGCCYPWCNSVGFAIFNCHWEECEVSGNLRENTAVLD